MADWPDTVAGDLKALIGSHVDGGFLQDGNAQIAGRYNLANGALSLSQFDFDGYFSGCAQRLPLTNIVARWVLSMAISHFAWTIREN